MENKNIHVLPTPNPSRLYKHIDNPLVITHNPIEDRKFGRWCINQNIYITNSEEIKEGDWFITDGLLWKANRNIHLINSNKDKKIILTTDQDLINDGIEQISEDTLLKIVEHINSGKNIESFNEL